MEEADRYRCRRIFLKSDGDPARQAQAACEALANLDGILLAAPHSDLSVHIIYSLDKLSFEIITDLLHELEFETENSLLIKLRDTIYCYLEDNARDHGQFDITEFEIEATEDDDLPAMPNADQDKYWDDYH